MKKNISYLFVLLSFGCFGQKKIESIWLATSYSIIDNTGFTSSKNFDLDTVTNLHLPTNNDGNVIKKYVAYPCPLIGVRVFKNKLYFINKITGNILDNGNKEVITSNNFLKIKRNKKKNTYKYKLLFPQGENDFFYYEECLYCNTSNFAVEFVTESLMIISYCSSDEDEEGQPIWTSIVLEKY